MSYCTRAIRMSELASIIDGIFAFGAMRVKQTRRLYETSRGRVVNVQFAFLVTRHVIASGPRITCLFGGKSESIMTQIRCCLDAASLDRAQDICTQCLHIPILSPRRKFAKLSLTTFNPMATHTSPRPLLFHMRTQLFSLPTLA